MLSKHPFPTLANAKHFFAVFKYTVNTYKVEAESIACYY